MSSDDVVGTGWGLDPRTRRELRLQSATEALVQQIIQKPRVALQMGKALFYRQLEKTMGEAYSDAATTMACNMMDDSALEGVQAFIDKRPPNW